jgi:serine/threonine-protein kinase
VSFAEGLVGITLDGRYRLDALLGEGGMGAVFRATHLAMERKVAVKLLKPHLVNDETQLQRFAREARSTLKVDSPHAVKVLDFGVTPHKDYYMVLEYLDGRTVQRELDIDGPFTAKRTVHIARHALHALGAAHRSGFVHRDIKPDNLLLMRVGSDPDYTKVLDFGVAKLMEGAANDPSQLALTQVGMVFGTPEFMSPEQACGHSLDGRSDLYSLAATMFVMMTGNGLFEGGSAIEWLTHHARTPPPRLSMQRPELATYRELEDLLERCLAKYRDKRPATAEELDELLAKLEDTLDRPAGSLPPTNAKRTFSASSANFSASAYMHALPAEMVDAGTTLLPPDLAPEQTTANLRPHSEPRATTMTPSNETGMHPVRSSRRAFFVALGALVVIGMITTAVVIASSRRGSRSASIDAAIVVVTPDAALADAAISVGVVIDASSEPPPDAAVRVVRTNPKLEEHLRKAEEALRSKNLMGQLTQADLALQADPRNQRAKFLYGDALIKYNQVDKGCRYLRAAGKKHPACRGD